MQVDRWSKYALLFLLFVCGWYGIKYDTWGHNRVIQNDVVSYYAYLPAAIIFKDLNFGFTADLPEDFEGTIWLQTAPGGKPILRMTMGLALLWTPFFLLAHLFASVGGIAALGYSWPYSLAVFVAAMTYLFMGLYYLRKILLRYFPDTVVTIVLLLIVLATNLMHYVVSEPGMSHVFNFGLITAFLYFSIRWTETPTLKYALFLGFLAGLIVLIRPVNVLVLFFPALTGISSLDGFKNRITSNWKGILIAGIVALLVLAPQMLYWKAQTGQFIFNSYMDQGKFFFLKPEIINGLFSYRKGWLLYTPLMLLAFAGIFMMKKTLPSLLLPIVVFALLNIYIVYSWWCWWYGGSFGSRPMIDMYGVMAIPMAVFIDKALNSKKWFKLITIALLTGFVFLNLFQMSQYRSSLLHWDSMTKEAYWGIFGKKKWPEGYEKMIKTPDYDKALRGEKEYPTELQ